MNKTKAVLFRPKGKYVNISDDIIFNSSKIEVVPAFKTLGVFFSENMSWDAHINYVTSKLSSIVGLAYRHKHVLPFRIKLLLYNSLFYSQINYGHLIWGTTTNTNLQKIFLLQKKILRSICNVSPEFPTDKLFSQLDIVRIFNLYRYRLCVKYKAEMSMHVRHLTDLADLKEKIYAYPTRIAEPWEVPYFRTNYGLQTRAFTLPTTLNYFCAQRIELENMSIDNLRNIINLSQLN